MVELSCFSFGSSAGLQLGDDRDGERLAQLDPPLVEGVDPPDRPLGEDAVLVEGDQGAERERVEPLGEDRVGGAVALHHPVRHDLLRRPLGPHLLRRLAEGERLALREDVRHQEVVVVAERVVAPHEADEVAGDQPRPLVDQLVEGVLAVGSRLAPEDRPGVVVDMGALERDVLAVGLHRQLLQVGGEAVQVLVVGEDAAGLGAEEAAVPDREQAHQHRQVAGRRRLAEVLVHRVEAGEHLGELRRADRQHGREADRRVHRVAAADPVPEAEHVLGVDAELRHLLGVGRDGDEVLGDRLLLAAQTGQQPLAGGAGVGHRLQRGEGLRGDHEERLRRVEVARGLGEVGAVDVGDEAEGEVAVAEVAQRLVSHHRAEVGAADADVDDVADQLAGVAGPGTGADPLGEVGHAVERLVHLLDDVDAVDDQRALARHPQRHVQHGAVLGDVDVLAGEHRFAARLDAALAGQLAEQDQRLVSYTVLGEVEVEAGAVGDEALAAFGVGGEELAQVGVGDLGVVALQRRPGLAPAQRTVASAALTRALRAATRSSSASRPTTWRTPPCPPPVGARPARRCRSRRSRTRASTCSASPPSAGTGSPTSPWSANACRVGSGIVLTVKGEAKPSM